GFDGRLEPYDRLGDSLATERESLEMDRKEMPGARVVCHANSLLGSAMRTYPGAISADGHDGQLIRSLAAKIPEGFCPGCVAAKNDLLPLSGDHIAVIAAIFVILPTRAPVFDLESLDFQ